MTINSDGTLDPTRALAVVDTSGNREISDAELAAANELVLRNMITNDYCVGNP